MPEILSHTPAWLSRPSPGFAFFTPPDGNTSPAKITRSSNSSTGVVKGPRRTIAQRGTEIFVALGNQIRWADLTYIKGKWEQDEDRTRRGARERTRSPTHDDADDDETGDFNGAPYRTLKVPVSLPITQLIPSPNGNLLAILTSHTVHIAILPDPSHLGGSDTGPLRVRTHTLGPTSHVLGQSPVMSALWHPLGPLGSCLVTVTADAVVRLWELNPENRWSFDSPALAVDLTKLADGVDAREDYGASSMGRNKGFSPDSFEMEVAAACFGGQGSRLENGWSPMTLWVAMCDGDVYALCPLLPSRWQPPPYMIPSLSVAVVSQYDHLRSDPSTSKEVLRRCQQRFAWVTDIDNQEPTYLSPGSDFDSEVEVYHRPVKVGSVPKLQGPFEFEPDLDNGDPRLDAQITDIRVIAAKRDVEDGLTEEMAFDEGGLPDEEGLSMNIICLITNYGRVHVCLDVTGVEGTWLPEKRSNTGTSRLDEELPILLNFESIDTVRLVEVLDPQTSFPCFSPDPCSRHAFFATHARGVSHISLAAWIDQLESEFQNNGDAGVDFRLGLLTDSTSTLRQRIIEPPRAPTSSKVANISGTSSTASIIFRDSDLGYFVLTECSNQPCAALLDSPPTDDEDDELYLQASQSRAQSLEPSFNQSLLGPSAMIPSQRPIYAPPQALWSPSPLTNLLASAAQQTRNKSALTEHFSSFQSTLVLMTEAHKILSQHTHSLGVAAADLFRRCERLQQEFKDQIRRAEEIATRIDLVTIDDESQPDEATRGILLATRLEKVQQKQSELSGRYETVRRKLGRGARAGRDLSDKETAWAKEVRKLSQTIFTKAKTDQDSESRIKSEPAEDALTTPSMTLTELSQRYQTAKSLSTAVITQAQAHTQAHEVPRSPSHTKPEPTSPIAQRTTPNLLVVPPDIRKAKVQQIMNLLEREEALVDATRKRLEKLSGVGLG